VVSISVTDNPTAEWIAGQVTDAFPWDEAPYHLLRDRDGAFGQAYTGRIRAMRIRDHPTAPRSPWQNGHVERLISSIRRESLDHLIVFDEAQLRRVLKNYASSAIRSGRISHCTRMRPISGALKSSAPSQASRFSVGCIINMSGFSNCVEDGGGRVAHRVHRLRDRMKHPACGPCGQRAGCLIFFDCSRAWLAPGSIALEHGVEDHWS